MQLQYKTYSRIQTHLRTTPKILLLLLLLLFLPDLLPRPKKNLILLQTQRQTANHAQQHLERASERASGLQKLYAKLETSIPI
jgi:hypothetical protein